MVAPWCHDHGDILSTRLGRSWKKVKDREGTQTFPSKMQPGARVRQTLSVPTGGEQAGGHREETLVVAPEAYVKTKGQ